MLLFGFTKSDHPASRGFNDLDLRRPCLGKEVTHFTVLLKKIHPEIIFKLFLDEFVLALEKGDQTPFFGQLQRPAQLIIGKDRIACEIDISDANFGSLVNLEDDFLGSGCQGLGGHLHPAQRPSILGQEHLNGSARLGKLGRIKGRVHGERHPHVAKSLQNVGLLEGFHPFIFDGSNQRSLDELKNQDDAVFSLHPLDLGVGKKVGIQEGVIVAQGLLLIV